MFRSFAKCGFRGGQPRIGDPVAPTQRSRSERNGVASSDLRQVAADKAAVQATVVVEPRFVDRQRQRLQDRRLAQLRLLQFALVNQPFVFRAQRGLAQFLFGLRLAGDLLAQLVQVDEYRDLGLQHHRIDRLEDIIDRAHRVAAHQVLGFLVDRRQENDRDARSLRAFADQRGRFVAVHIGHEHVEQDYREIILEVRAAPSARTWP